MFSLRVIGIRLVICVDDVAPVEGWGYRDEYIDRIQNLIKDYGCKFTLFVVPNLKCPELCSGIADLRLFPLFLEQFDTAYVELGVHGYDHFKSMLDGREFFELEKEETFARVEAAIDIFKAVGMEPKCWKSPGWYFNENYLDWLATKFKYVCVNQRGNLPIHFGQATLVPYTSGIHETINPNIDNILTSHINLGPNMSNKNAFTEENYQKLRAFIEDNKDDLVFMTLSEYLESL